MSRTFHSAQWLTVALMLLLADQATKAAASHALAYGATVPVGPYLNWVHAHNTGAAFSFLADAGGWQRYVLSAFALAVAAHVGRRLWKIPSPPLQQLGLAGVMAGALGNAADRIRLGYVEDFIDVHVVGWHWPAFNMADVWLVLGVSLWVYQDLRRSRQPPAAQ